MEANLDLSEPTEADLLSWLRGFAEASAGTFPAKLEPLTSPAQASALAAELGAQGARSLTEGGGLRKLFEEPRSEAVAEMLAAMVEAQQQMWKVVKFVTALPADSGWHYSSEGVRLGDSDKPLCWWRPAGSDVYRVVYGDLSVGEVAEDDLPVHWQTLPRAATCEAPGHALLRGLAFSGNGVRLVRSGW